LALWRELSAAGWCDLYFLDESGFAPTLPTGYTWARIGSRARVWDEPPQGRRLNVLGALAPYGAGRRLVWTSPAGKIDGAVVLEFIWREVAGLPAAPADLPPGYRRVRPCVVVLDNGSAHVSRVVKDQQPALEAAGVTLSFLPPYSPELNRIEDLWRHLKHEELPVRSYQTLEALGAAVEQALADHAASLATHAATLRDDTSNIHEAA